MTRCSVGNFPGGPLIAALFVAVSVSAAPARVSTAADVATAIAPGDTVVVVKDGTAFGIRGQPMSNLTPGQQLRVTEVRGKWIGGYVVGDNLKRLGWVNIAEVGTVQPAAPVGPSIPDTPDDARAAAELRKLGCKLQLDDQGRTRQLVADQTALRDEHLVHLAGIPHLLSLDLTGREITDAGLTHVARCRGLQKLYLAETKITDQGLTQLASLAWLEVFSAPHTSVTGAGLAHLQALPNLRVLNLGHCAVRDEDLQQLTTMSTIEVLALPYTQVTDQGLTHLRTLGKLRVLNLDGTPVTGKGFENLLGLSELRMLYIRKCKVDAEHIEKLDSELSGLAIYD